MPPPKPNVTALFDVKANDSVPEFAVYMFVSPTSKRTKGFNLPFPIEICGPNMKVCILALEVHCAPQPVLLLG